MDKYKIDEMECPACGATMRFDPEKGDMVCDWCGTRSEIDGFKEESDTDPPKEEDDAKEEKPARQRSKIEGFDFASLNDAVTKADAEDVPIYNCRSCGAELIAPPSQISLACPYCGNNVVLTDKVSGKLRPDGIIPFKLTPKTLPDAMNRFYKNKVLLPKDFFSESSMSKVTGVYVPFWLFTGSLSGHMTFSGEKHSDHREGDYIVTETSHYNLERDVSMSFKDVPVDASGRIDDALMDSLESFDLKDKVDFDMRYLAGFTSERFDVRKREISARAKKRMFATAEAAALSRTGAGYSNVRKTGGNLKASINARYLLLPVYMFNLNYDGKNYEFAVNGQTGNVVGTLPIDKGRSIAYFSIRAVTVAAAIIAVFVIKYFSGN